MKRFQFRLDRVLAWRWAQARIEESALRALQARMHDLQSHVAAIQRERMRAGQRLIAAGGATGQELALLDSFRQAANAELARLERSQLDCRWLLEERMAKVTERRRAARLLEKLKERQRAAWTADYAREIEQQAAESYLARWNR